MSFKYTREGYCSFLNKEIHLCNPQNDDLHVKDVYISGIFNGKSITIKRTTKATNKNKDTLLNSKSCIYRNATEVLNKHPKTLNLKHNFILKNRLKIKFETIITNVSSYTYILFQNHYELLMLQLKYFIKLRRHCFQN